MAANKYSSHAALEQNSRASKAAKITTILSHQIDLSQCSVLDIGTGSGHIAHYISQVTAHTTSVNISDERVMKDGYDFRLVKDEKLPFEAGSFDVVISNHVIEHLPHHRAHLQEIHRVLKKDGILYLATPNKYTFIEPHFQLPFLSWLPTSIANRYALLFRKKEWDIYPLSHNYVQDLTSDLYEAEEWSLEVLKHLKQFHIHTKPIIHKFLDYTPNFVFRLIKPFIPTFIFTMKKK